MDREERTLRNRTIRTMQQLAGFEHQGESPVARRTRRRVIRSGGTLVLPLVATRAGR